MDQEKIGRLIANLRKEKGMTQRELGEKVGVGFKAVSKWERGVTIPDISIINDLSKILGITSDELLNGELSEESKTAFSNTKYTKRINKKFFLFIPIIIVIGIILIIIKLSDNRIYVYNLSSNDKEYNIEGKLVLDKNNISIYINAIEFYDYETCELNIKNYDYEIYIGNRLLMKYGYIPDISQLSKNVTIRNFFKDLNINYNDILDFDKKYVTDNTLVLKFNFIGIDDKIIEQTIPISIKKATNKK